MKVRLIQAGAATFEYRDDDPDAAAIRTALAQWTGGTVPGIIYDVTDLDRSDTDPDEYLIIREDDGTVLWEGWLGGVDGPAPFTPPDADDPVQRLLALDLPDNDSGTSTVRGYLTELLLKVWREEEGFDGKRPFGNSSWQYDIYVPMIEAGLITGKLDEDGYVEEVDDEAADALILAAIEAMGRQS